MVLFVLLPTSTPNRFNFSKYFWTRLATCLAVRRPPMACEIRAHLCYTCEHSHGVGDMLTHAPIFRTLWDLFEQAF